VKSAPSTPSGPLSPGGGARGSIVRQRPKRFRAMEGKDFRNRVYRHNLDGEPEFDQARLLLM
jgi:hypothetical protein